MADKGMKRVDGHIDTFSGAPISKGMSSGNSPATTTKRSSNKEEQDRKAYGQTQNVGEKSGWKMEDMPQMMKGDNTQKPQSITPTDSTGRRPSLESKGSDVWGTGQSKKAPSKTDLGHEKKVLTSASVGREESMGGTRGMKGMNGKRSGGSHGDWYEKRSKM